MDLFSDLIAAVQSDMNVGSESSQYSPDTIKLAINRAYRKAGIFRWPELEDAKKTSSVANQEYYEYPDTWQPDSIWKLEVDYVDYGDPLVFKDFLFEKDNSWPSGKQYAWSNQWRRFFIYPIPTASGSNNICVWGVKNVTTLASDGDTTIFSYSLPSCNEALVLEAVAILKSKGEQETSGQFRSSQAQTILLQAFSRIAKEQSKYEKTTPFFEVPDFFLPKNKSGQNTGNFN